MGLGVAVVIGTLVRFFVPRLIAIMCGPSPSLARCCPAFRIDAVCAVPLLLELLARCRRFGLMFGRSLLQPGGFGGLDLGFGLCGPRLGGRFLRKCLTPLEFGCLEPR